MTPVTPGQRNYWRMFMFLELVTKVHCGMFDIVGNYIKEGDRENWFRFKMNIKLL